MKRVLVVIVFFALLVVGWEVLYRMKIWSPVLVPSPVTVGRYLIESAKDGTMLQATIVTMKRLLVGYVLSIIFGLPLGLLTARFQFMEDTLGVLALGLQTLPSVCWIPLALLWFGQTEGAMLFVVIMGSLWSILIATDNGVRTVPPIYARAARTMGSGQFHTWFKVILPAALPFIVSGMKQGWGFAWRSLMGAEIYVTILTGFGLGHLLHYGRELNAMDQVIGVMLVIIVIGLLADKILFSPWEKFLYRRWGTAKSPVDLDFAGIAVAIEWSVKPSLRTETTAALEQPTFNYRLRYYGFCTIVALAFMLMGRATDGSDGWTLVYLPFVSAILLVMSLAGVECTLYVQRVTAERRYNSVKREEDELHAIERQRAFNYVWQELADNKSSTTVPAPVLTELATLFSADLVAVWSGDKAGGFRLDGAHPLAADGAVRLDKVAHMSPCFERLRATQRLVRVTDFERDTTKAFAWFCEENGLKNVILCPVLVRHDLVGVLAFFYRDKQPIPAKITEEMQSAANLFLCAL